MGHIIWCITVVDEPLFTKVNHNNRIYRKNWIDDMEKCLIKLYFSWDETSFTDLPAKSITQESFYNKVQNTPSIQIRAFRLWIWEIEVLTNRYVIEALSDETLSDNLWETKISIVLQDFLTSKAIHSFLADAVTTILNIIWLKVIGKVSSDRINPVITRYEFRSYEF